MPRWTAEVPSSLARMLEKELEEKGRLSWVEEECLFLSKVRFTTPSHAPLT